MSLYLSDKDYKGLARLRVLTGIPSLVKIIRSALKIYLVIQEAQNEGEEIALVDKTKEARAIFLLCP